MARKDFASIGLEVRMHGFKRALSKLDPARAERALDQGLDRGSQFVFDTIKAQSRVKTARYFLSWVRERVSSSLYRITNAESYAEFVTGRTQHTTLEGGRRRGAAAAFMRKISREVLPTVRKLMDESIREHMT
jgi:HEAT repeat protein